MKYFLVIANAKALCHQILIRILKFIYHMIRWSNKNKTVAMKLVKSVLTNKFLYFISGKLSKQMTMGCVYLVFCIMCFNAIETCVFLRYFTGIQITQYPYTYYITKAGINIKTTCRSLSCAIIRIPFNSQ